MAFLKTTTTAPTTTPKKKSRARAPLPAIQTGQIWQMQDANLRIDLIGKTLVHYKLFRGGVQRAPVSLTGKAALEKFLIANSAVLIEEDKSAKAVSKVSSSR